MFRELKGDIWSLVRVGSVIVVTTNGVVKDNGRAVMGKGIAKYARDHFHVDVPLGKLISAHGNHCYFFPMGLTVGNGKSEWTLVTFPTKHHWRDKKSDIELIAQSAEELLELADTEEWSEIYLPRVGCGSGGLEWIEVVTSGALDCLDERFTVVFQ